MANTTSGRCGCKVGRVAAERGLDGLDGELVDRRTDDDRASLRDLAAHVNRAVLRSAVEDAGMSPLDGEVENAYRLLTDEGVTSGARTRARRRLQRDGVDVAAVREDFVSHTTVARHLAECLDVEQPEDDDPAASARDRVLKVLGRAEAVARSALAGLADDGTLAAGDLTVVVDARVVCADCGTQYDVETFLERGGCECDRS